MAHFAPFQNLLTDKIEPHANKAAQKFGRDLFDPSNLTRPDVVGAIWLYFSSKGPADPSAINWDEIGEKALESAPKYVQWFWEIRNKYEKPSEKVTKQPSHTSPHKNRWTAESQVQRFLVLLVVLC